MGKKKKRGGNKKKGDENIAIDNEAAESENVQEESKEEKDETEEEKSKFTVEDLMTRVEQYLENFEHNMALMFCQKALDMEPNNVKIHECYGNVYAETGDVGNAMKHFNEAVRLEPDTGHVKYLYLGQITEGREAVQHYEKGIVIMKETIEYQKNNKEKRDDEKPLSNGDVANVYCSLAEIFMTDCCMEDDAEEQCEKYCKLAVETDEKSLDAAVSMSNLLLNQSKMDDAKITTEKALSLWTELSANIEEDSIPENLSYEARVTLIKLLIEVEMYDKVSPIVDQLIEENEDDIRIWYYLGLAKSLMKDTDNPRFYLEKALELIEKTGFQNDDMVAHIEQLLVDCPPEDEMDVIEEGDEDDEDEGDFENENEGQMDVE